MLYYLTYGENVSGVYKSQVIDLCSFINKELNFDIKLIALISCRQYSKNRKQIKKVSKNSIVLPSFPKITFWYFNILVLIILFTFLKKESIICRGPLATALALMLKKIKYIKKVCYDGRGASSEEFKEYNLINNQNFINKLFFIEKKAVINSNYIVSVSNSLINYWKEKFEYRKNNELVIPCTLMSNISTVQLSQSLLSKKRKEFGFNNEDIILVYSGSCAGWQSFDLLDKFISNQLFQNDKVKVLFMSKFNINKLACFKDHSNRIYSTWIKHDDVNSILSMCDYGLLIRDQSITNKVASPVKFAEYLYSGLPVIISQNLGDYSTFVKINKCGIIVSENSDVKLSKVSIEQKRKYKNLALANFSKISRIKDYIKIINKLTS
ncbi:MAG TPA: hypothetical protein QF753_03655 [Victivallales bacterium]|nr:hypothetical protein [Victivallales bacterium]